MTVPGTGYPGGPSSRRRAWRRALARRRRLLAAGLAAAAVAGALRVLAPDAPPAVAVWVAARDLPAGHTLEGADLRRAAWPPGAVPAGVMAGGRLAGGEVLASPLRRGEPVTDARLLGPGLTRGLAAGTVAVPVRLADTAAARLLHAGDVVDLLATGRLGPGTAGAAPDDDGGATVGAGGGGGGGVLVAGGVRVLAVLDSRDRGSTWLPSGEADGALVLVACDGAAARRIAAWAPSGLSVAVRAA